MYHCINVLDLNIYINSENGCFSDCIDDQLEGIIDDTEFLTNFKPTNLYLCLNISNACNLSCSYCFNREKTGTIMNYEQAIKSIEKFLFLFPNCDKYYIDLSGKGEPLLNLKLIFDIKDFCNKKSDEINREILISFVTNGVLLTPNIAKSLQNKGILFGVSLDGKQEIHDKNRRSINGSPTFTTIINNIKKIENKDYVGCAVTIGKDVFCLVDSLVELSKYFKTISYKPVRSNGGFDLEAFNEWKNEYIKLVYFLEENLLNNDYRYIKILLNGDDYFGKFLYRCLTGNRTIYRCDAGITRFSINYDGKVYGCPASSLSTFDEINIDSKAKLYGQYNLNKKECSGCPYFYICGGECSVNLQIIGHKDEVMCQYKKLLIQLAMYLTLKITYMDEVVYKQLISFCKEKESRSLVDQELNEFLIKNPQYSFTEGKKVFDNLVKRY